MKKKAALFVMPRKNSDWNSAKALWITLSGWANAADKLVDEVWIVTLNEVIPLKRLHQYPIQPSGSGISGKSSLKSKVPLVVKTLLKDIRLFLEKRKYKLPTDAPWQSHDIAFVWQQHDLFGGPGKKLADKHNAPLITKLDAPLVWESRKWGVKRPIWGYLIERFSELSNLKQADMVACVSPMVEEQTKKLGIEPSKLTVSSIGVDIDLFTRKYDNALNRKKLSISVETTVFGWVGSFRSFHGIDTVIKAFAELKLVNATLVMVGDGPQRYVYEELAQELGVSDNVIFTGAIPFTDIPSLIHIFDVAIISADVKASFHYSPMKLREYLASKKATIAPGVGEIPEKFKDGLHLKLYEAGSVENLRGAMSKLAQDPDLRSALGNAGFEYISQYGTWEYELRKVLKLLDI